MDSPTMQMLIAEIEAMPPVVRVEYNGQLHLSPLYSGDPDLWSTNLYQWSPNYKPLPDFKSRRLTGP